MYHRMFVHMVWTTRDRLPTLDARAARFLEQYLPMVLAQERARCLGIGIVATHVHLLARIHPATDLPRLAQRMKGGSASIARRDHDFAVAWAKGYSVSTVSERSLSAAWTYVTTQHLHHAEHAIPGWPETPLVADEGPSLKRRLGQSGE